MLISLIMVASLLAACGTPAPEATTEAATEAAEPVTAQDTPQPAGQEAAPKPEAEPVPAVGGTLVYILDDEMDTLDVHKSGRVFPVCQFMGGGLIIKDTETDEFLPYLAESWTVAEDGMEYEFKLREDVLFHDGTPLTAHDYAWSFNRAKDPKTQSPTAGASLTGLAIVEAVDDYTLRFRMAWPNSVLMHTLSNPCYHQPLSQAYVEEMGDDYGRHPIGVGPFKFKEWVTGERIVLERTPDYAWGPEFTHGGPPFIETIEYRIIPEYATQLAGLEAGEVDHVTLAPKDLERIQNTGEFQILESGERGSGTHVVMNPTRPPFDDLLVRRAFNHAVNREPLIKIVRLDQAAPIYGPLTPFTDGYWPEAESFGYDYDMDRARELLAEAGYTPGGDGWLEKDGQPLVVSLNINSSSPDDVKIAEILQEQFKGLGVQIELEQLESGVLYEVLGSGDFDMTIETLGWENFGIMFAMFHSSMVGAWNRARVTDMNDMISAFTVAPSWDEAVEASNEAQRHVVEQAYFVPLYAAVDSLALSNKIKDVVFSGEGNLYLFDAYIETSVP